jgi:hypothetical protein
MRTLIPALLLALSTLPAMAADAVVSKGTSPAVSLTLPEGWTTLTVEAKTVLKTSERHPHIQVWATDSADVATAAAAVAKIVESEVTHFTASSTTELTVAGSKALALIGTGEEADDGDPSLAEVTFFSVNQTVYVLIAHGEGDGAAKQRENLRHVLASAKAVK